MNAQEMLVAIMIPLGFFAMVFGIIYMQKKENLAMIEKGMNPREWSNRPAPYRNLKWGLLLLGSGAGLFVAFLFDSYLLTNVQDHEIVYFALIGIGGGLGLVGSYRVEKKELLDKIKDTDSL